MPTAGGSPGADLRLESQHSTLASPAEFPDFGGAGAAWPRTIALHLRGGKG